MTTNNKQMMDAEKKQLGDITAKREEVIAAMVEDAALEKANDMLKAFMASPIFNGTNAMVHAIEGLTAAINANTRALNAQSRNQFESDLDLSLLNARRNFAPTPLERQLLALEIPADIDLQSPWQLISIRNRMHEVDMPSGSELSMEYIAPVPIPTAVEPTIIPPVVEEPVKKRVGKWTVEMLWSKMDEFVSSGGNVTKGLEFKKFSNGGYQWAIKNWHVDGEDGRGTGGTWVRAVEAYMNR